MFSRFFSSALIVSTLMLTGCASSTLMPFSSADKAVIKPGKATYLMSATIRNDNRASHQPKATLLNVERITNSGDKVITAYTIDNLAKMESNDPAKGNTYLLRLELENASYTVRSLISQSNSLLVNGNFVTPIHATVTPTGPGVFYLGHLEAVARKRADNEFKAGPAMPLIDQAASGASTSTFDIEISDRWSTDEASFKERFPVLQKAKVEKAILPPFDRKFAQKWWEDS